METRATSVTGVDIDLPAGWGVDIVDKRLLHFFDPKSQWLGHIVRVRKAGVRTMPRLLDGRALSFAGRIEGMMGDLDVYEVAVAGSERSWCTLARGPEGELIEVVIMPLDPDESIVPQDALDRLYDITRGLHFGSSSN